MEFRPAHRLSEVVRAWEIVHDAYVRTGLIPPIRTGLFLHREALAGRGCVAVALEAGRMVATAGGILDGPAGLPLDRQFPTELAALQTCHRLIEIGSLASEAGDVEAVFGVIAVLLTWGESVRAAEVVLGCHPAHLRLYRAAYGVRHLGEEREYEGLAAPVVLGAVTYRELRGVHRARRGVRAWLETEVDLGGMMEPARIREIA